MWLPEENPSLVVVYDLLYRTGRIANSTGFFYTAYAVWLSAREPDRLTLVTKWLYPDVAKHYGTNWSAVEHGIRRIAASVWNEHPQTLSELAGYPLTEKPTPTEFLAILASHVSQTEEKR